MKNYYYVFISLFIAGAANAQTTKTVSPAYSNGEMMESVFTQWNSAMANVRNANNASTGEFATFSRFEENPLQVLKAGIFADARKSDFDPVALSANMQAAEKNIEQLYQKYLNAKKMYSSSVSEYTYPRVVPSVNPCDSTGCNNIGFENGNFNGWYGYYGVNNSSIIGFNITNITGGALGAVTAAASDPLTGNSPPDYQLLITSGGYDAVAPSISRVSPWGGTHSVMLGDSSELLQGVSILSKTFLVTASNSDLTYEYAVILENPGHPYYEQPFFAVTILDENGDTIPTCGEYRVTSGFGILGFDSTIYAGNKVYYKNWTMVSVPLKHYIGQCVTITFESADCSLGGHFGYAYIDASCSPPTVASSSPNICGTDSVELLAPPGAGSYYWYGPANGILGNDSLQTIWVDSAGTYSVVINPLLGHVCSDTVSVTLGKLPSASIHPNFTSNIVCVGQPTVFTNTSNPSGGTFNWDFYNVGNYNDTNVVNPTWTYPLPGTYTVKLQELSGGCGADTLITVVVDSSINASFTGGNSCIGSSATFTNGSRGATSYIWVFGDPASGPNDSSVATTGVHTYTAVGTYTVTLLATNGSCSDTISKTVTVSNIPSPIITGRDSICASTNDTLKVTGGTTYLWINGATTSTIIVAPAVTKTITVAAFNGTCSHDTTFTINVVATASLSVSASPNLISAGDSSVLSARCSVSATFAWAPSGSVTNPASANTEATPTVTTTYTCTATTACGTYTDTVTVYVGPCINNYDEPICIVTVDTATGYVALFWGRTNSPPQSGFGWFDIYKDSTLGFESTHTQPLNVLSDFTDPNSHPSAGPVSYELATTDSCGVSALSAKHTTIYLTVAAGVNAYILNWTSYVGFTPSRYRIFRGLALNAMVQIDSVPNSTLTYTDSFPPLGSFYAVEAVNPSGTCIPTMSIRGHRSAGVMLSGSFSNGFNTAILGVNNIGNLVANLNIYPNPSNGQISLEWSVVNGQLSEVSISILNELGQVVYNNTDTQVT
ncbi:MAG TPA: PKD domain-containing protein, partial [Bacteroidia bacterium]|nr:PKD domain-containing protein [Bacteroidia bacterium]